MNNEKETTRAEAFSDGVFAIAITLLILRIVPDYNKVRKRAQFKSRAS